MVRQGGLPLSLPTDDSSHDIRLLLITLSCVAESELENTGSSVTPIDPTHRVRAASCAEARSRYNLLYLSNSPSILVAADAAVSTRSRNAVASAVAGATFRAGADREPSSAPLSSWRVKPNERGAVTVSLSISFPQAATVMSPAFAAARSTGSPEIDRRSASPARAKGGRLLRDRHGAIRECRSRD